MNSKNTINTISINNSNINFLQWNVNGFFNRLNEIKILINTQDPNIICLQETNFTHKSLPNIKGFQVFTKNRISCSRASGGVAIFTDTSYPAQEIPIISHLEVIAIRLKAKENLTICNIYLPNLTNFNLNDIQDIINQLPAPFFLLGDFNSHNSLWGSQHTDDRGRII
jgi:exonuclease III